MISRSDIQDLIHRDTGDRPVMSVFLDMSVNSENKRTHDIFLSQQKARYSELDSDRPGHHREPIGEAFARVERWLVEDFDEANKGVALYLEVGGGWLEGLQFPVPIENRVVVTDRPVVGPVVEVLERYHHHGVVLVDREHLRLLSLYLDQALYEEEVVKDSSPAPHDIRRGGYAARTIQNWKEEEERHVFKEFADEVQRFVTRHRPDDLILLGTDENVQKFREYLASGPREKIVHTERAPVDATTSEVIDRLRPFFEQQAEQHESTTVSTLRERVRQSHKAVAGFHDTLEELQEGKVRTLILARGLERTGVRCEGCGFYLARHDDRCPYCGGQTRDGIDIVEALIRLAEEQDLRVEFVEAGALGDLNGVGGLLRF